MAGHPRTDGDGRRQGPDEGGGRGVPPRDVVVRCRTGEHKVRLAPGLRFWASARCPRCRAAVDPWRVRRVAAALGNLARPRSSQTGDRILHLASLGYSVAMVGAALLLWGLSDVWWPGTVLLFGPRWILLLPLALLLPWAARRDRALLAPLVLALLVGLGPVMGLRTGWRAWFTPGERPSDLRVVTFNAQGGEGLPSLDRILLEWRSDIALFQECRIELARRVRELGLGPGRSTYTHAGDGLCMATRFPIAEVRTMDRSGFEFADGAGMVRSYVLETPDGPVRVTNLHLETPRRGLELLRAGKVGEAIPWLEEKSLLRRIELEAAERWADARGEEWDRSPELPTIVGGDFNTPPESRIYRGAWGHWTNAFSAAGRGLGGTRLNGWIRARIDHVVVDEHWTVVDARPGADLGSDHLPMIATLRRRSTRPGS